MYKRFTEGDACEDKGDRRRVIRESLWTVTQVSPLWEWRGKEAWVGRVSDCCIILRKSQSGHWEVPEPKLFFRGLLCLAETQCSLWTPLHALSSTYIHLHAPHLVCLSRNPSRGSLLFPSHVLHCLFLFSPKSFLINESIGSCSSTLPTRSNHRIVKQHHGGRELQVQNGCSMLKVGKGYGLVK